MCGKGGKGGEGDEAFDWDALVPRIIHPMKEAILEALLYMRQELSEVEIGKLFDDPEHSVSRISYHLDSLAGKGILVQTRQRQVQGVTQKFYYLFFPK